MKAGIDFFPLEVYLDERYKLIEAEFGLTGFAVIVKLLQRIFAQFGYYGEFTREVALLFGKSVVVGGNAVSEIVEASVKRGVFDKTLYDRYQILTSEEIQKKYFEAVKRRKKVEVKREYLLINCAHFNNIVYISGENVNISKENADIFKQSKVKYSKVNKEKIIEKKAAKKTPPTTRYIFKPPTRDEIIRYCEDNGLVIDVDRFIDYYQSNGWRVGSNKMRDWQATVRNWARNSFNKTKEKKIDNDKSYDMDEIEAHIMSQL